MSKKVLLSLLICLSVCESSAVLEMKNNTNRKKSGIIQDFFNTEYGFREFRELARSHIFPYLIDTSSVENFVRDMEKYSSCKSWSKLLHEEYFLREAKKRIIENKPFYYLMTYLPKTDIFDEVLDVSDFVHEYEDGTMQIIIDPESNNVLHYAVKTGNFDRFKKIIKLVKKVLHKMINMKNSNGLTPLHALQMYQKEKIPILGTIIMYLKKLFLKNTYVELLKKNGADENISPGITQEDKKNFEAILNNDFIKVETLLQQDVNVNVQQGRFGNTPLHVACSKGNEEIVRLLLKKGANVDAQNRQRSIPLHVACGRGNVEIVELLLKQGTGVNVQNKCGDTPLHIAFRKGNEKTVELLLDAGVDVNVQGRFGNTPLHYACLSGRADVEIVKLLLDAGADINVQDKDKNTPLHYACLNGRADVEIVKLLLDAGVDVNVQNKDKNTPLHSACFNGRRDVVELLLKQGADVNVQNKDGETPLHIVCWRGNIELAKLLF
jgi:ankyrin repeat protein